VTHTTETRLLRINEAAAEAGLTTRAIRYYEEMGLLEPAARSGGDYRLYDQSDLERLLFIRSLRDDAGFSLAQIRQLLEDEDARERNRERFRETQDPAERRAILIDAQTRVDRQIEILEANAARRRPVAPPGTCRGRQGGGCQGRIPVIGATFARDRLSGMRHIDAFHHRNYRLFFMGQLVSLVGTWMQQVAQAWLVLQLTGDPIWLGIVASAQFLPVMILGLFGGVLADALPKRQVLLAAQVVMMVLAFVLAALVITGVVEVWMILVLAVLLGIANAVDMPVRQSFAVELVGRDHVGNAVALNSAMFNAARIVGPAAAGLAIGAFGVAAAFLVNGLSFLAVIVGLWLIDDNELELPTRIDRPTTPRAVVDNLVAGLAYVRQTPVVLLAVVVVGTVATAGMNWNVLIPAFAQDELNSDAAGYGFLMAASGVGSLLAALRLVVGGRPRPSRLATGALILGVASVALALVRVFPLSLGLMFLVGFGAILMAATGNTTIQMAVPDHLRGRVMSVYTTVFSASVPIGGLAMGAIASAFGTAVAIGVGGVLTLIVGVGALAWGRRGAFALPATGAQASAQASSAGLVPGPGVARPR
jgi:DNA-binding transcriptional MerR regulator/MFS family permease